jgi:hypothetical protein
MKPPCKKKPWKYSIWMYRESRYGWRWREAALAHTIDEASKKTGRSLKVWGVKDVKAICVTPVGTRPDWVPASRA